jgi:hypothetical protein
VTQQDFLTGVCRFGGILARTAAWLPESFHCQMWTGSFPAPEKHGINLTSDFRDIGYSSRLYKT